METILQALKDFEKRNNISVSLTIHSDGSGFVSEFWDGEELFQFDDKNKLYEKLATVRYELDKNGRCYSPVRLINPTPNTGGK